MTSKDSYAIKVGARILVTGANGFVASSITDFLLSLGYLVRGTVRSEKPWLNETFEAKYGAGKFETVNVPALDDDKSLEAALNGISGVIHVASDVTFGRDPTKVIPAVVAGTETVLRAASKVPSVKRVVLTSSSVAAALLEPGEGDVLLSQDTWSTGAIEAAWSKNTPPELKGYMVYAASKAEGERAAFGWVEKNKPGFVFNSVLPDFAIGEVLHPNIGSTGTLTAQLLKGDDTVIKLIVSQYFIDAKDVARLHAIALLDPSVRSERLFGCAAEYSWKEVVETLHELRPSVDTIVKDVPPPREGFVNIVPTNRSKELLSSFFGRSDWTSLKDSLEACILSLML